ncbi:UDP-N-acetylglucosamine acyltransferase [Cryobacterium mannosilyticum]|uniref:UDP-N-acetylglucosamine acyltransferase n=1 Tax=Cryobacterium mannosilyticum TaxID=1259190 RepID=A0A4R8W328_9MICO|nr:UDP-N-acetylglucosamine acyltransferase [Cryobacterium mannosilyticum]TFC01245.1 UDP-N-acetylglucosamine acyltransferase [Cryobacterium mannosilyticum]
MNSIHSTAQLIGEVALGSGNMIGPLVVIIGPVTIGDGNWIGTGAVIGAPPEVRSWQHPMDSASLDTGKGIVIGDRNVIREYVQIHQGWHEKTSLGNDVFLMNQSYVAHDCTIEDRATLASSVLLAGHVRIGEGANLGLGSSVHQRCYVADGAMIGMGSVVTRNIPPFAKAYGNPARVVGANTIGMQRAHFPEETIAATAAEYGSAFDTDLKTLSGLPGIAGAIGSWRSHHATTE